MSALPSKASLARVVSKATVGSLRKKPKFSHHRSAEKDQPATVPQAIAPPVRLTPPIVVDLEAALETAPTFDECIEDLPLYIPEESSKEKEKLPPSLLANEEEAAAHLRLVLSNQDMKSL